MCFSAWRKNSQNSLCLHLKKNIKSHLFDFVAIKLIVLITYIVMYHSYRSMFIPGVLHCMHYIMSQVKFY